MIILAIQSTYTSIEIGLYNKNTMTLLGHSTVEKIHTSLLLDTINMLLNTSLLTIKDVGVCVTNCGPAPFTTLRTVIATVNGLKAALNIPVIGINGLDALSIEYNTYKDKIVIVLDAFGSDFYFYLNSTKKGLCSKDQIRTLIEMNSITHIAGNGGPLIKNSLTKESDYHLIDVEKGTCSLNTLIEHGIEKIDLLAQDNIPSTYITPLYFKEICFF